MWNDMQQKTLDVMALDWCLKPLVCHDALYMNTF